MSAELYDPNKVTLTLGTLLVSGYTEGTMISVSWLADSNSLAMGGQGVGAMIVSNDLSAEVTINLQQTSRSNDRLTAIFAINRTGLAVPISLRDGTPGGSTLLAAATGWIKKFPDTGYASNGIETRTWVITTDRMDGLVGGNSKVVLGSAENVAKG